MFLAQGHNAVTPVRLEPAAPGSRVKHFTTEPLHSSCPNGDPVPKLFANWIFIFLSSTDFIQNKLFFRNTIRVSNSLVQTVSTVWHKVTVSCFEDIT